MVIWKNDFSNGTKFLKGCLPQISLGPFLNTLSHISLDQLKWIDKKNKEQTQKKEKNKKNKTKEGYKVKNIIKNTPFKLRNIHQCRGLSRNPSKIKDGDFCKNS